LPRLAKPALALIALGAGRKQQCHNTALVIIYTQCCDTADKRKKKTPLTSADERVGVGWCWLTTHYSAVAALVPVATPAASVLAAG
jgi:hypothetical protein